MVAAMTQTQIIQAVKSRDSRKPVDPVVELVVPIYNEQATLEASVRRVHAFSAAELWMPWRITVADNATALADLRGVARMRRQLRHSRLASRLAMVGAVPLTPIPPTSRPPPSAARTSTS